MVGTTVTGDGARNVGGGVCVGAGVLGATES